MLEYCFNTEKPEGYDYIIQKGLEKAKTEIIKQMICNDMSLSNQQKTNWLNAIDSYSRAKDINDLLTFLSNSRW